MKRKERIYILVASAIGLCVGSILCSVSLQYLPTTLVTFVAATSPFMVAIFSAVFYKARLQRIQEIGIVLVILESAVISL